MAQPKEITMDYLRKQCCKFRIKDITIDIEKSRLSHFRCGRGGLNGENVIKLINFLKEKEVLNYEI